MAYDMSDAAYAIRQRVTLGLVPTMQGQAIDSSSDAPTAQAEQINSHRLSSLTVTIFIAFFVLLGSVLRLYKFWAPDLWIDEYATWWTVAGESWGDVHDRIFHLQNQSPLFYYTIKLATEILGIDAFSLRLPSVLFGIGLLAFVYPMGVRLFQDRFTALMALAVFAVNEKLIWYAQDARPYSLALLCSFVSFFYYLTYVESGKRGAQIGYVLATAGAYYAHYLFGLIIVVQVCHLILKRQWARFGLSKFVATFGLVGLMCVPSLPHFLRIAHDRQSLNWAEGGIDASYLPKLAVGFFDPPIFVTIVLSVLCVGMARARHQPFLSTNAGGLLFLWFLLPLVLISLVMWVFGTALLVTRYLLYVVPAVLLIVAWIMALGERSGLRRWVPLAVFLIATTVFRLLPALDNSGTFRNSPYERWFKQGWAQAARVVNSSATAGDVVLLASGNVESDRLGSSGDGPLLRSSIRWPLMAHLPSDHPYRIVDLPARWTAETMTYLAEVYKTTADSHRIWIIGISGVAISFADKLLLNPHFSIIERRNFGSVTVMKLEQSAGTGASSEVHTDPES